MNKFEKYQDNNLGKKINPLVVLIREGTKINSPQFSSKLEKIISNFKEKNEDEEILSDRLIKLSLERVAEEDYSGQLPIDSSLSEKYSSLLKKELFQEIKRKSCFHDYKEIRSILENINKNVLDDNKAEELINEAMNLVEGSDDQ
jgi:thymidylate synthase ThyX